MIRKHFTFIYTYIFSTIESAMTEPDPPSPSSKEQTTPRRGTPTPPPEPEKKPVKKIEPPVLVAIISAVATMITAFLGSPLLLTLVNQTPTPASTSAAEVVISHNSLLPDDFPGGELFKATFTPTESNKDIIEFTSTPQGENPTTAPSLLESTFTSTALPPNEPDSPIPAASSFFQCIAADTWFPYPTTLNPEIGDGCWNLPGWGFSTDQGQLLLVHNPGQDQQRGIYTPISGDADIRFSIQLNEFRTRSNKVGFLNFGIVQNDPFSIYSGSYLNYQKTAPGTGSPVRVLISASNQGTQIISDLKVGFQHEVLLSVVGDRMTIFKIHTRRMSVAPDVDYGVLASRCDGGTGADIHAMCTEAGMFAIREDRDVVTMSDFERAIDKVLGESPLRSPDSSGAMYASP